MLYSIFSTMPFIVCLLSTAFVMLRWKNYNDSQRMMLPSIIVDTIVYGCHCYLFTEGYHDVVFTLWMCSVLLAYPFIFFYVIKITSISSTISKHYLMLLIPAVVFPVFHIIRPEYDISLLLNITFVILVLYICIASNHKLRKMDKEISNVYSDTEDKSPNTLRVLMICIVVAAISAIIFRYIGHSAFSNSVWIALPSTLFSVIIYAIIYNNDLYSFNAAKLVPEKTADRVPDVEGQVGYKIADKQYSLESQKVFISRLDHLINDEKIYIIPNLKIDDLAQQIGTNRTYLSRYINKTYQKSFADFINSNRILQAQRILEENPAIKTNRLSIMVGFSTVQSFLLNYRKFTGNSFSKR